MTKRQGFTLLELLLAIGLVALLLSALVALFHVVLGARAKNQAISEVEQQGAFAAALIAQTLRNAESVTSPALGASAASLTLDVTDASDDPTVIDLSDGALRVTEGAAAAVSLTSYRVIASDLEFRNLSASGTPGTVRLRFTLTHLDPEGQNEYAYAKTFYGTANLR
jgi:prepilin-type N-terminal cleavage/methylation domain-containing protein